MNLTVDSRSTAVKCDNMQFSCDCTATLLCGLHDYTDSLNTLFRFFIHPLSPASSALWGCSCAGSCPQASLGRRRGYNPDESQLARFRKIFQRALRRKIAEDVSNVASDVACSPGERMVRIEPATFFRCAPSVQVRGREF